MCGFFEKRQEQQQRTEAEAKDWLNELRQNELSVGAALRRGETVNRAPGQSAGCVSAKNVPENRPTPARQQSATSHARTRTQSTNGGSSSSDGDFATSMAVGMATGNAGLGYFAGGDLLGGSIGAAIGSSIDSSCDSDSDSGCESGGD